MPKKKGWIVTTSGDRPVTEVASDLTKTGFAVDQVLDEIGCITGRAEENVVDRLRNVRGVTDISPDGPVDIGPPDAPETW